MNVTSTSKSVDGSNEIQLTDHPGMDSAPSWSPDGSRIAFSSDREDNVDVYVMKTNGEGVRRLTEDLGNDYNPTWSPDGEHIVFYRSLDDGRDQIWVREVDGAREWDITNDNANNIFPCFLASGSIGFSSTKPGGSPRLICVEADGSIRRAIGPYGPFFARWSPDGSTIAFIAGTWPRAAIYVMRFDGVGVRKIVN